jgi:hypothetical protein
MPQGTLRLAVRDLVDVPVFLGGDFVTLHLDSMCARYGKATTAGSACRERPQSGGLTWVRCNTG